MFLFWDATHTLRILKSVALLKKLIFTFLPAILHVWIHQPRCQDIPDNLWYLDLCTRWQGKRFGPITNSLMIRRTVQEMNSRKCKTFGMLNLGRIIVGGEFTWPGYVRAACLLAASILKIVIPGISSSKFSLVNLSANSVM